MSSSKLSPQPEDRNSEEHTLPPRKRLATEGSTQDLSAGAAMQPTTNSREQQPVDRHIPESRRQQPAAPLDANVELHTMYFTKVAGAADIYVDRYEELARRIPEDVLKPLDKAGTAD
jgi:hypothetical protein